MALIHERVSVLGALRTPSGPVTIAAPRHNHEALGDRQVISVAENVVGPGNQRVVGLKWHEHRAIAAVSNLVETMVKELPEDREQCVERLRKAIRRHVLDEQGLKRRHAAHGSGRNRSIGGLEPGTVAHGKIPAAPWLLTGKPAAATAARLAEVLDQQLGC